MRSLGLLTFTLVLAGCGSSLPQPAPAPDALSFEGLPAETGFDEAPVGTELGGEWQFRKDPGEVGLGEAWFAQGLDRAGWATQQVPGTWNVTGDGELDPYQGAAWLARRFELEGAEEGQVLLRFGACFLRCRFWLNGQELAQVERPYLPIVLDATGVARSGVNELVARVDNRITEETVPVDTAFNSGRHGWWPYGGLTRQVTVEQASPVRAFQLTARTQMGAKGADEAEVEVGLFNHRPDPLRTHAELRLRDPQSKTLAVWSGELNVPPGASTLKVKHPLSARRWSRAAPENLYAWEWVLNQDPSRRWVPGSAPSIRTSRW